MPTQRPSPWLRGGSGVQPLVLVVEDEPHARQSLVSTLATHGFRTLHAGSRAGALTRAVGHEPNLLLIDVGDPGIDGVGLTARLREWTSAPIVVLLQRGHKQERSAFLDAGANDYLVRPFATDDLVARMRVWLRETERVQSARAPFDARTERVRIDRDRRSVFVEGREIHITPLERKLLLALARSPGRSMSEEQILAAVWGPKSATRAQYLRSHVRQLRQKIEKDPARPRYLVTDAGGGYRLNLG
ncbi:MAG: response regulator transcription factor [Polyangiaceae bacterium]